MWGLQLIADADGARRWLNAHMGPAKLGPTCAPSKPQPCLGWTRMLQRQMHCVPQQAIAAPSGVFPSQPLVSWSLAKCLDSSCKSFNAPFCPYLNGDTNRRKGSRYIKVYPLSLKKQEGTQRGCFPISPLNKSNFLNK